MLYFLVHLPYGLLNFRITTINQLGFQSQYLLIEIFILIISQPFSASILFLTFIFYFFLYFDQEQGDYGRGRNLDKTTKEC